MAGKRQNKKTLHWPLHSSYLFPENVKRPNFDKAIEVITKNKRTIGIREMVFERAKKEGLEKGRLKGREEGKETKGYEVVTNLIIKMGMTDSQAADIAGVSADFVKKVRRKLKK